MRGEGRERGKRAGERRECTGEGEGGTADHESELSHSNLIGFVCICVLRVFLHVCI